MKKVLLLIVLTGIIFVYFSLRTTDTEIDSGLAPATQGSPRLAQLLGGEGSEGYATVIEPRRFEFPRDHGPHADYRNEWWYITGNLDSENNQRFGFELTLFRFLLAAKETQDASAWRSNQVFVGHFAITDSSTGKFHVAERYSRGGLGLAGAQGEPFRVWLNDWELRETSHSGPAIQWHLSANDDEIALELLLTASKSPVLNGVDGLSQKSATPGNASYYYSIPRLETKGTLRVGPDSYEVSGLSWLDREWGSSGLSKTQQGWDWFALQLSDGSDLMFYNLRRMNGEQDEYSAGTYVSAEGVATPLSRDDLTIEVLEHWDSPRGVRYPMGWRLQIKPLDLSLVVTPIMRSQELSALVRYWEGAVDVKGEFGDSGRISGRGYVELTGYADALVSHKAAD